MPVSRDHHYVPRFLLREWLVGSDLHGYWWDERKRELRCKRKGVNAFCFQFDLLLLNRHQLGRDAVETKFFGPIDTQSSIVREKIIAGGIDSLSSVDRSDFARLLLSLEMRKPETVERLRQESMKWAEALNADKQINDLLEKYGVTLTAVEFANSRGLNLEDRAVLMLEGLVDNKRLGPKLINAEWHVVTLGPSDGTFAFSDLPLIKFNGFEDPGGFWVLPLDPRHAFVATKDTDVLNAVRRTSPQRFAKLMNYQSAQQARRFVFSIDPHVSRWIEKYLKIGLKHPTHQSSIPRSGPRPGAIMTTPGGALIRCDHP